MNKKADIDLLILRVPAHAARAASATGDRGLAVRVVHHFLIAVGAPGSTGGAGAEKESGFTPITDMPL